MVEFLGKLIDLIDKLVGIVRTLPGFGQIIIEVLVATALLLIIVMYFTRHTDFERIIETKSVWLLSNAGFVVFCSLILMTFPIMIVIIEELTGDTTGTWITIILSVIIVGVGLFIAYFLKLPKAWERYELWLWIIMLIASLTSATSSFYVFVEVDNKVKVENISDVSKLPNTIGTMIVVCGIFGLIFFYYCTKHFPTPWYWCENTANDSHARWYIYRKMKEGYLCGDNPQKMKASTLKILTKEQFCSGVWKKYEPEKASKGDRTERVLDEAIQMWEKNFI